MTTIVSLDRALTDPYLLAPGFGVADLATFRTWFAVAKAAYAEPLSDAELAAFKSVAGDRLPPACKVQELVVAVSRRAGKGRISAALAVYEALLSEHLLAPGERGFVVCISPTIDQSRIVHDYVRGFLETSPTLRQNIENVTAGQIELKNGNSIVTLANDFRHVRGRTLLLAILDEAAFLRDETSANPDIEAARALLPGLMTTGGLLVILSSPHRKSGLLWERHRDYYGKDDDDVLVVQGASTVFNPTLDQRIIERLSRRDPAAAVSELFGEFRTDLTQFLGDELIDRAVDRGRPLEISPQQRQAYFAFVDPSGGRHDAFTISICHRQGERIVVDVVRGRKPPFDPQSVVAEYTKLAQDYGCKTISGDSYAGDWVASAFNTAGLHYRPALLNRSELYLEGLPHFTRGIVSIPDNPVLLRELRLLERKVAKSGKDSVDHPKNGSDDFANALFGALNLCAPFKQKVYTGPVPYCGRASMAGNGSAPIIPPMPGTRHWADLIQNGGSGSLPRSYGDHPGWRR
jgi:hypothetical protein